MSAILDLPQDLIDRVAALSPAERDALFALFPADAPAPDPELKAMLTQRWQDYRSGKTQAIPLDDHLTHLDAWIRERSSS